MSASAFPLVPFSSAMRDCTGGNIKVQRKAYTSDGELPVVDQGQDFIAGYTQVANQYKGALPLVLFGDHTRIFKYVDFPFALGADGVKALEPQEGFDAKFLFYYFRSVHLPSAGYSRHFKFLKEVLVPKPSLPEQRRIVDLLSRAEGIVRLRREAEKKAAELIPALFIDMFGDPTTNPKGWPLVKLADVCGKCATRDPKKHPDEEFTYIDIAAIDNEHGQVSETKTMLGMDAPSRARQVVQADDVIVSTVRPNLRGSAWIPQHLDGQVCSTGFCVLRPSNKTTTGFIYAVIRSDWFVSELMKHVRGAQYPAVSDKDVFGVQIPLPPLSAQQEFASRLDVIRSIQSQQSMAITKAQATFNALLARVFNQ